MKNSQPDHDTSKSLKVGIISDTHGLLRPEAQKALNGVDLIIHAGDVGSLDVLAGLESIAPVYAVRGNMDGSPLSSRLHPTEVVNIGSKLAYVIHDVADLDLDPFSAGISIVISGHTHLHEINNKNEVLYINPGSAGPRRSNLPITLAIIEVGEEIHSWIVDLERT